MWEYKVVEINEFNLEQLLNELGQQGWELCGLREDNFVFKRGFAQTYPIIIDTPTTLPYRYEDPYKITCNS